MQKSRGLSTLKAYIEENAMIEFQILSRKENGHYHLFLNLEGKYNRKQTWNFFCMKHNSMEMISIVEAFEKG